MFLKNMKKIALFAALFGLGAGIFAGPAQDKRDNALRVLESFGTDFVAGRQRLEWKDQGQVVRKVRISDPDGLSELDRYTESEKTRIEREFQDGVIKEEREAEDRARDEKRKLEQEAKKNSAEIERREQEIVRLKADIDKVNEKIDDCIVKIGCPAVSDQSKKQLRDEKTKHEELVKKNQEEIVVIEAGLKVLKERQVKYQSSLAVSSGSSSAASSGTSKVKSESYSEGLAKGFVEKAVGGANKVKDQFFNNGYARYAQLAVLLAGLYKMFGGDSETEPVQEKEAIRKQRRQVRFEEEGLDDVEDSRDLDFGDSSEGSKSKKESGSTPESARIESLEKKVAELTSCLTSQPVVTPKPYAITPQGVSYRATR